MFRIEELRAGYGKIEVLRGVSLYVDEGEIVTVIGPNGAGKSTLLKSIVGLTNIMSGRILLDGVDITGLPTERMVELGISMVPEGSRVFPEMTVYDNLLMGAYSRRARKDLEKGLEEIIDLFPRLGERLHQKAKTLSGGERQALAIGRALLSKPRLLLMDEPSLGLHPRLVLNTFKAIEEINSRGVTILLVEQNVFFSLEISRRGYVLENGVIVLQGSGQELLNNEHVKKAYLSM